MNAVGTLPLGADECAQQGFPPFESFAKTPRLSRDIVITEKIDGCNAQIVITEDSQILAGTRNKYITVANDVHNFAQWVEKNRDDLITHLGPGRHFGEWWGSGIHRGYGLTKGEKRFSLLNTGRWFNESQPEYYRLSGTNVPPECCSVVPILYMGDFHTQTIEVVLNTLAAFGSSVAPGFMRPEGIMIYHTAANMVFKKTIKNDGKPKSQVVA